MKLNSTKTHTFAPSNKYSHPHTHTHMHTDAYLLIVGARLFAASYSVCFALHYAPKHTRIHKSLSAPRGGRDALLTPSHAHARAQLHTLGDRHSSHKQLSRNHNKFTSAAQMFDKKFLKSFHWFRNVSTISMPRLGGGQTGGGVAVC